MKQLFLIFLSVILVAISAGAEGASDDSRIGMTTDFTYRAGAEESQEVVRALALYGAAMKAVTLGAKYFVHKGVLAHYEKRQHEIFCLVAGLIEPTVLDEKNDPQSGSYYIKIQTDISPMDFIRAENEDAQLQKKEAGFSFDREMNQPVSGDINPGRELSRAYRYIRKEEWRIAVIYLDHLEKKYPNWGAIPLAKAITLYSTGDTAGMKSALDDACRLGSQEACDELTSFSLDAQ